MKKHKWVDISKANLRIEGCPRPYKEIHLTNVRLWSMEKHKWVEQYRPNTGQLQNESWV